MKRLIKSISPPILLDLARSLRNKTKNKTGNLPQFWTGETISNLNIKSKIKADNDPCFRLVGYEGRVATKILPNSNFLINTPKEFDYIDLSFLSRVNSENFELIFSNGHSVKVSGPISSDRFFSIRIKSSDVDFSNQTIELKIKYPDSTEYHVAEPIFIQGQKQENFILLVLDSLVKDQVGLYGDSNKGLTNYTDKFFKNHYAFSNAFSQGEWTISSMSSMMCGITPIRHGNYNPQEKQKPLPSELPTLPELLKINGYNTFCFSTGRRFVPTYGHFRGFDKFFYHNWWDGNAAQRIVNEALQFIETRKTNPFFCLLHFYEPHPPFGEFTNYSDLQTEGNKFLSPGRLNLQWKKTRDSKKLEELKKLGDSKVMELDFQLSTLYNYLEANKLTDNTTIILTSDHGRTYEKDVPLLVENLCHTPFLIRSSEIKAPKIIDRPIQSGVDIFPTILNRANIPLPDYLDGLDISVEDDEHIAITESPYVKNYEIAARDTDYTLIKRYPFDHISCKINLSDEQLWFYKRAEQKNLNTEKLTPEDSLVFEKLTKKIDIHLKKKRYYDENTSILYKW